MKLEINVRKKNGKNTNMCILNNVLLKKKKWVNEDFKRKSENTSRQMITKRQLPKSVSK